MTPAPVPPVPVPAPDSAPVSVPHNGPLVTEDDIAAETEALRAGGGSTVPRTTALESDLRTD
ncbi:hypothetical protein [Streptomyces sp. Mg1]|uniref:hypothetical protein n=1 Tax=Streptomyces sp. Mg1 TaxID=465541 RepID=UPI00017E91A5|nr:hypothetical protein [Streptomyces sp. Mg1]EDX23612.1 hypothetical protein SSAG_03403 [Streptomyces sp. Mg1]